MAATMAAQQQLFERVELRGEDELERVQALLADALERRIQAAQPGELSEEDERELRAAGAELVAQLREFVVFAPGGDEAASAPTTATARTPAAALAAGGSVSLALRSPLLPPLSPPPADAEVAELEAQVTAAALRVAELRASMQAQLQEQLAAKLAACRPTAELDGAPASGGGAAEQQADGGEQQPQSMDADGPAEAAGAAGEAAAPDQPQGEAAAPQPLSPQPEELQQRLLAAANRMPTLRARLETANDRLQRVVAAVAADINRPEPNTVEKAVLGKTPGRPAGGGGGAENEARGVSPLVQQALESGQISTRRRGGRDVQPVPFSQPE